MRDVERIKRTLSNLKHTFHAVYREYQQGLTGDDIETALMKWFEIIEEYDDDPRGKSYLLLTWLGKKPLHIVCAPHEESLILITKYEHSTKKWEAGYRKRR